MKTAEEYYSMGKKYASNTGSVKEYKKAFEYFKIAADKGHAEAQCMVAYAYMEGDVLPENYKEGLRYYQLSADQENISAHFHLGQLYSEGEKVERDLEKAINHYKFGADHDFGPAQFQLAICYEYGNGTKVDLFKALTFYNLAVENNIEEAAAGCRRVAANIEEENRRKIKKKEEYDTDEERSNNSKNDEGGESEDDLEDDTDDDLSSNVKSHANSNINSLSKKISLNSQNFNKEINELRNKLQQELNQQTLQFKAEFQQQFESILKLQNSEKFSKLLDEKIKQRFQAYDERISQMTVTSVESEIVSVRQKINQLDEQMKMVQLEGNNNSGLDARIAEIEEVLIPMKKEFDARQLVLRKQQHILANPQLKTFYFRFQVKLNQIFSAYMTISSGQVNKSNSNVVTGINLLGQVINVATLGFGSLLTDFCAAILSRKEDKTIANVTEQFIISLTTSEALVEEVARELILRYEDQIKELTLPNSESFKDKITFSKSPNGGAEVLADSAVARIVDGLKNGKMQPTHTIADQFIDIIFTSAVKEKTILGFGVQKIDTLKKIGWNDKGIFQSSGVKVKIKDSDPEQFNYYKGKEYCDNPSKYFYRLGSAAEIGRLNLTKQTKPDCPIIISTEPSSNQKVMKEIAIGISASKHDAEFHKKTTQLEIERRIRLEKEVEALKNNYNQKEKDKEKEMETVKSELEAIKAQHMQLMIYVKNSNKDNSVHSPSVPALKSPTAKTEATVKGVKSVNFVKTEHSKSAVPVHKVSNKIDIPMAVTKSLVSTASTASTGKAVPKANGHAKTDADKVNRVNGNKPLILSNSNTTAASAATSSAIPSGARPLSASVSSDTVKPQLNKSGLNKSVSPAISQLAAVIGSGLNRGLNRTVLS